MPATSSTSSTAELVDERARRLTAETPDQVGSDELRSEIERRLSSAGPTLRRIGLDEPDEILDRLVEREPVHPFAGRSDLADRLDEDRRCFLLEHEELPGRPMNVVWVALCNGVAGSIDELLDPSGATLDPSDADTAVFYSIWNIEPGLVGIRSGRSLLEATVASLRQELPGLHTFVTLSPIPGFRDWAREHSENPPVAGTEMVSACVRYLLTTRPDGRPIDPVARFHLGNGARLVAVHEDADRSERGQARSFGMMANYRYEPESREQNRLDLRAGRPAVSSEVEALVSPDSR